MANILLNGNFTEEGWTHDALICKYGEGEIPAEIGNIFSPANWLTWFRHEPNVWDQPEVRDARSEDRLYDGHKAMVYFTFYRKHWGGLMQQVPVIPGQRYRLTAYAHAWSNSQNGPHVDDPRWSEGPGYGAGYMSPPLAENVPPPAGPGTTDDWRNFAFNVGLDPTGGVNPFDASVRWGPGASIYNQYGQVPAVEVTATEPVMTVWLRSRTLWPFKHNDAYWGAASLELVEPEPEPPEPCQCIGLPRTQYERTYNVVPANATEEQAVAVFLDGWRRSRETTGGSYDDAGIGALDVRRARLYGIPTADRPDYEAFYAAYYPGVEVEFAWYPGETEPDQGGGDIALSQNDPRWKDENLGEEPGGETIGQAGCLLTTLTMMLRQCGEMDATPPAVNKILADAGTPFVEDDLLMWPEAVALFDCFEDSRKVNRVYTAAELADLLADGWLVGLMRADGKHFVYLESIEGDAPLHIIDPWDGQRKTWTMARVGGIRAALIRGTTPEPDPPPVPVIKGTTPIGYHAQVWAPWMHALNTELKMRLVKSVDGLENIYSVLPANPDCTFIYRQFGEQHTAMQGTPAQGAAVWIAKWIDSVRNVCDELERRGLAPSGRPYFLVESLNETYACFDPRLPWMVEFDREFIRQLRQAEPRVGAAVFCAPVGNPHESEFSLLTPLAIDVSKAGPWAAMGYHAYWYGNRNESGMTREHWPYLQGRWAEMDVVFRKAGAYPRWFFGESGVVGGRPVSGGGYYLNPGSGWLDATDCYGGDWAQYEADWRLMLQWTDETPAGRDGLVLGANPFTTGASFTGWGWFQTQEAQYRALAAWLKARYL
jgi:hypothetical protein